MASNLGLVAHSTQRHAHELPSERTRDRLTEGCLSDPRGADEGEDGTASAASRFAKSALGTQLPYSEVLDDAVLHISQAGVIRVKDLPRVADVEVVLAPDVPWKISHPVEVRSNPAVLGTLLARSLETAELALGLLAHRFGHVRLLDLGPVLGDDISVLVLAELLADGGHLLAQEELALVLFHPLGDVRADLVAQRQLTQDLSRPSKHFGESLFDVDRLEHLDLLLERQVGRIAGRVGHLAGIVDPLQELAHLASVAQLEDVLDGRAVLAGELEGPLCDDFLVVLDLDLNPTASPVPDTPVPMTPRARPRTTRASTPLTS